MDGEREAARVEREDRCAVRGGRESNNFGY